MVSLARLSYSIDTMSNDSLVVPCASCGALNRVPNARLSDVPVCADCGERLLHRGPVAVDAKRFERMTRHSDLPVLVDFWAPWCGPCRSMAPEFEAAAAQLEGRVLLIKLDTEAQPGPAQENNIQSIPTMILFGRDGHVLARQSGAMSAAQILQWVDGALR